MRKRLHWTVLLAILLALVALILGHDAEMIDRLTTREFSSLAVNVVLAVFVGAMVFVLFRERLSKALEAALFWTAIGLVLLVGYTYRVGAARDRRPRDGGVGAGLGRAKRPQRARSPAAVPAIFPFERRSMARASRWCWTAARAPWC